MIDHPAKNKYGEVAPVQVEKLEHDTLVIEDEVLRRGFTSIPNYILDDRSVSIGAKYTFIVLLSFAWEHGNCFPGQRRLADKLGLKERMVRYYLSDLEAHGWIEVKQRGLGQTNVYIIKRREADRQNIAAPERQWIADQDRHPIADKEYPGEKDSVEKDSDLSKYRKVEKPERTARGIYSDETLAPHPVGSAGVAQVIEGLSKTELNDPWHVQANITQAQNLWHDSKSSEEEFVRVIQEARKRTVQHSGIIYKTTEGGRGAKNRAPYFFKVLKTLTRETMLANFRHRFKSPP